MESFVCNPKYVHCLIPIPSFTSFTYMRYINAHFVYININRLQDCMFIYKEYGINLTMD